MAVIVTKRNTITVFSNPQALFLSAAKDFAERAIESIINKGVFNVVLAGGNTPKVFFDTLVNFEFNKKHIQWEKIKFFFGDERYVASDNEASNYRMAEEHFFSKLPILKENIYRVPTELHNPNATAFEYENMIRQALNLKNNELPNFDLVYLGLGEDAHTASLFPFNDALNIHSDNTNFVVSVWLPERKGYRITLTALAINAAQNVIFLVTGENKASAVFNVLEGELETKKYPAQLIHCAHNNTFWFLDKAAASELTLR